MPDFALNAWDRIESEESTLIRGMHPSAAPMLDVQENQRYGDYRDFPISDSAAPAAVNRTFRMARLFQENPIARRYIEILKSFTMGSTGPIPIAKDKGMQELLDEFWFCPHNNWPKRGLDFAKDLATYGEQAFGWGELYEDGGKPIIGLQYIYPNRISRVEPYRFDRWTPGWMEIDRDMFQSGQRGIVRKSIVKASRKNRGQIDGSIFFCRINNIGIGIDNVGSDLGMRGSSDLYPLADWLILYDQFHFTMGERLTHISSYFFDVLMEGAGPAEVAKMREELLIHPIRPGSFFVHNDRAELKPVTIDLQGNQLQEVGNSIYGVIATGGGIPPHWTGIGQEGGRNIAEAAVDPVFRFFSSRQATMREFLSEMLRMQLQIDNPSYQVQKDDFKIVFPRLGIRDLQRSSGAAHQIVQAATDALNMGLISKEFANKTIIDVFMESGLLQGDATAFESTAAPATAEIPDHVKNPPTAMDSGGSAASGGKSSSTKQKSASAKKPKNVKEVMSILSGLEHQIDDILEDQRFPTEEEREAATMDLLSLLRFYTN